MPAHPAPGSKQRSRRRSWRCGQRQQRRRKVGGWVGGWVMGGACCAECLCACRRFWPGRQKLNFSHGCPVPFCCSPRPVPAATSSLPTPAGGGGCGDEEGGDDGVTPQQKKSKTRNDKRLEQKQARAKEAAAASKKKSNKLMEVGADLKTWWRVAGGGWLIERWGRLCGASASVPFADGRCQPPINQLPSAVPLPACPPARLPACCRRLRPRAA